MSGPVQHNSITGTDLHEPFQYVASSDPGSVGAGKYWLDTSGSPYLLKRRNGANSGWITVGASSAPVRSAIFTIDGDLTTSVGTLRLYNRFGFDVTISEVFLAVDTAPTGASLKVDVNLNGTTIFTTQANRPAIAIAGHTGSSSAIDVPTWTNGSYLTVDVDQVGSTVAGSTLTVQILFQ